MSAMSRVSLALAILAVVLVAAGTSSYSVATADRAVSIDVVDDSAAELGLERDLVVDTDSASTSVTVANRLATDVTVEIEHEPIGDDRPSLDVDPDSFSLAPGDDREVRVSMACPEPNTTSVDDAETDDTDTGTETESNGSVDLEDVELDIHARGSNVEIELTRSVTVGCAPVDSTD